MTYQPHRLACTARVGEQCRRLALRIVRELDSTPLVLHAVARSLAGGAQQQGDATEAVAAAHVKTTVHLSARTARPLLGGGSAREAQGTWVRAPRAWLLRAPPPP